VLPHLPANVSDSHEKMSPCDFFQYCPCISAGFSPEWFVKMEAAPERLKNNGYQL